MAKEKKSKSEKKNQGKFEVAEVKEQKDLPVEIQFPTITGLQHGVAFDANGKLMVKVAFVSVVDQYELFRLVNLLKQPHGSLYAKIGSLQSALDFKFTKDGRVEIVKAQIAAEKPKDKPAARPEDIELTKMKIHTVSFNHIPNDPHPFGVHVESILNGSDEIRSTLGRGVNPTEAVIDVVERLGLVASDPNGHVEPFEARQALEELDEPSPECFKLLRVLDVGTFEE